MKLPKKKERNQTQLTPVNLCALAEAAADSGYKSQLKTEIRGVLYSWVHMTVTTNLLCMYGHHRQGNLLP